MRIRGVSFSLAAAIAAGCLVAAPAVSQDPPAPAPGSAGERVSQIESEANAAEAVVKDALAHCDPSSLVFAVMRLRQLSAEINNIETQGRRAAAAGFPVTVDVSAAAKVRAAVDAKFTAAAKIVINMCRRRWVGTSSGADHTGLVQPAERILEEIGADSEKPRAPPECDQPLESVFDDLESDWAEKAALGNSVGGPTSRAQGLDPDDIAAVRLQQAIIDSIERAFEEARQARANGDRRMLTRALLSIDEDAQDLWDMDGAPDDLFNKWGKEWRELRDWVEPEPQSARPVVPLDSTSVALLTYHNNLRSRFGSVALQWDPVLQQHATEWAQIMSETGKLEHAPRDSHPPNERENIVISRHNASSPMQMVQIWGDELENFHPGIFPNVCTGDWTSCAHASQILWSATTHVGCGFVQGKAYDALVCRYSPKGNIDGKPVLAPITAKAPVTSAACPAVEAAVRRPVSEIHE